MKNFHLPKRFWVAISVSAVIGLFFFYYFSIFVADNEKEFIESKLRNLKRIGSNIHEGRENSLKRFALNLSKLTIGSDTSYANLYSFDSLEASEGRKITVGIENRKNKFNFDSVHLFIPVKDIDKPMAERLQKFNMGRGNVTSRVFIQSIAIPSFLKAEAINLQKKFQEFIIVKIVKSRRDNGNLAKLSNTIQQDTTTRVSSTERTTVTRNSIDREFKTESGVRAGIAYQTFDNELRLNNLDSLFEKEPGFYSGKVADINIQGDKYKIFTHRLTFDGNEDWLLCGLVTKSAFTHQTRHVELFIGLIVAFLIISILLSMPIIKLMVMSSIERLQITNVWFTGFSIVIGAAVIILLIMFGSNNLGGQQRLDSRLHNLAVAIDSSFHTELQSAVTQLKWFEKNQSHFFIQADIIPPKFWGSLRGNSKQNKDKRIRPDLSFLENQKLTYPFFNQIIWADSLGNQPLFLSTLKVDLSELPLNIKDRMYWQKAANDIMHLWSLKNSDSDRFALQSIRSWRSGNNEAGISIPINPDSFFTTRKYWNSSVLAMTTRLGTVMEPLLPPGYSFCIVDDDGKIWFHSDTELNNQEQLFEEVPHDELLASAIHGRDSIALSFKYGEQSVRGYVLPVNNLPLSLVVFYDMEYYHRPISLAAGHASIITSIMFILIGLHLLILFVFTYRPSKLKIHRFFLSWLRPRLDTQISIVEDTTLIQPSAKYRKSIFFFLIIIAFALGLMVCTHERWLLLCFLVLPIYVLVFHFLLYKRESILFEMPIQDRKKWWRLVAHPFVMVSVIFVVVVNLFGFQFLEDKSCYSLAVLVQTIWIFIGWFCFNKISDSLVKDIVSFPNLKAYRISFVLWLMLISFIAPAYFYKYALHTENSIWIKFVLLESARSSFERDDKFEKRKVFQAFNSEEQQKLLREKGNYLESTDEIKYDHRKKKIKTASRTLFDDLIFRADPVFGGVMNETREAIFPATADSLWQWQLSDDSISLIYNSYNGKKLNLAMATYHLSFFEGGYWLIMLIIATVAILLLLRLIQFAVKHIFGVGWISSDVDTTSNSNITQSTERIFIVGLPFSGKRAYVRDQFKSAYWVDFSNNPSLYGIMANGEVVVDHFEYGINSHTRNDDKLKILNKIINKAPRKIIILSTVQPSVIFDFYDSRLEELDPVKDRDEYRNFKQAYRFWKNILSGFTIHYHSLTRNVAPKDRDALSKLFLDSEIEIGSYLPELRKTISINAYNYEQKEEIVLHIEEQAENYYNAMWNSFSNDEKFLLYDLAKDRFVNFRNLKIIRGLLQKGVITMNDSLRIMNRSFNNFILSAVKEDEELKMEQKLRQTGTWHTVQLALILTLLGLTTFIALAQQGWLRNINAWVSALTGVFALITRFGGIFGSKPKE